MPTHIFKKNNKNNQLEVYIRELDYPQRKYEGFRLRLKSSDSWIDIPVENNDSFETLSVVFDNLEEFKRYKISGQVKLNNKWIDLEDTTFIIQPKIEFPKEKVFKGNEINFQKLNEPPMITSNTIKLNRSLKNINQYKHVVININTDTNEIIYSGDNNG